jgi:elongation factor 1-alpha
MSFLLCGQTDVGKSTVAGHLLYKVGYFNNLNADDAKFYRKELETLRAPSGRFQENIEASVSKSKFSILMDLMDGEISVNKTKTQEFNVCEFAHNDKQYKIIDTPGHKLYIRSLIEGLFRTELDCICLTISSRENEFQESFDRGTVKEDLLLSRSTGCKNLIILWNKTDLYTPSESMINVLSDYIKQLSFKNVVHLNVSGYTGDGLFDILNEIDKFRNPDKISIVPVKKIVDSFTAECMFFIKDLSVLISIGYRFIIHTVSGEYEVEINKITNKTGKQVIVVRDSSPVTVECKCDKKMETSNKDRLICRDKDFTIGFGMVKM